MNTASNADAMAALLAPYGRVEVVTKTGAHLDADQYPPAEIVGWFDAYH